MKDNSNILLFGGLAALGVFILSSDTKAATPSIIDPKANKTTAKLTPTEYIKKYYKDAIQSQLDTKVPALVTLAQGGLESYWGKNAFGNNHFGIKEGKNYSGKIQKLKTWECGKTNDEIIQIFQPHSEGSNPSCNSAGKPSYRVYAKFRAYDTASEGFKDHGKFLRDNKRYSKAFQFTDPNKFALEIAKAGYATAPNYATVLIQTIANVKKVLDSQSTNW